MVLDGIDREYKCRIQRVAFPFSSYHLIFKIGLNIAQTMVMIINALHSVR